MPSIYNKNYTERGYRMDYKREENNPSYSNWVLQFKIELPEILPSIWRRILVPSNYNFWDLHISIQDSMGWLDRHFHYFEIKMKDKNEDDRIGIPDFFLFNELPEVFPGWEIPIVQYFNKLGVTAKYLYDYGNLWWHTVTLEGFLTKKENTKYPLCTIGERACPPEECGGVSGYYKVLKTLSDPGNEFYNDLKMWVGKDWNPDFFNKESVKFWDPYERWRKAFIENEK